MFNLYNTVQFYFENYAYIWKQKVVGLGASSSMSEKSTAYKVF